MNVLVLNCGSSSLKAALVDTATGTKHFSALVERIGDPVSVLRVAGKEPVTGSCPDHRAALELAREAVAGDIPEGTAIDAVGHRVVHGGDRFTGAVLLDEEVETAVAGLTEFAPLHIPANLKGIRGARHYLPDVPHVAVFDTAFHAGLPPRARAYAIPGSLARKHHIHRYGFHGSSHACVARRAATHLQAELPSLRLITCHLGNGCSIAAVQDGRSVDTSMGMTPMEGLVMGTRCGDIDPGILLHLLRVEHLDANGLDTLLNRHSGLAGLSGAGNDLREIQQRAAEGDDNCRLAIDVFAYRIRKYIGAYAAAMGGTDAIVFTGGIGENSAIVREQACAGLGFMGALLDPERNRRAGVGAANPVAEISAPEAATRILVVATDEEEEIARETVQLVEGN